MLNTFKKIFGSKSEREVKGYQPFVDEINVIYAGLKKKSDEELAARTEELKSLVRERREKAETEADEKGLIKEEKDNV